MNLKKKLVSSGVLLSAMAVSSAAFAGASGNIAVSSDYLWRGMTQTGHQAAVSGGLDYSHDAGIYLGTWASNVNLPTVDDNGDPAGYPLDTEIDLYGGFSKEFGPVGIDVGAIYYMYPHADFDANAFYEVYGGVSVMGANIMAYYNVDADASNLYVAGGYDYEVANGLSVGIAGGWTQDGESHYGVSLTKSTDAGDFSVMVSDTTASAGLDKNPTMVVSYAQGFDF